SPPMRNVTETTLAEWNEVLAINLTTTMLCAREVVRVMLPRGRGAILNVSSRRGKDGTAGHADYSAAKWGVIGFTQALAREVGPHGIRAPARSRRPTLRPLPLTTRSLCACSAHVNHPCPVQDPPTLISSPPLVNSTAKPKVASQALRRKGARYRPW